MKKNYLYGAIALLENKKESDFLEGIGKVTLAKYKDKKNYYRLEFSQKLDTPFFKLEDAHISIFEHFDPQNSKLSSAHFTAHLNKDGNRYRLHVFLNENGHHVCKPCWEVYKNPVYIQEVITPEVNTVIAETLHVGMPVFRQLREVQTNLVEILSQKYEQLDEIHREFEKNNDVRQFNGDDKQQYLLLIDRKIDVVRQLTNITTNRRWPQLLSYYQAFSNSLKNWTFTENTLEESTLESKGKEKITKSEMKKQPIQLTTKPPKKQTFSLFEKLQKTFKHFEKNRKNTVILVELMGQLQESDQTKLSLTQLKTFHVIQKQTLDSGVSCYHRALLTGDFNLARQLNQFFDENLYKWMSHALTTQNIDLVGFLINDLDFPIENYPIKTNGKEYANVLEYCYDNAKYGQKVVKLFDIFLSNDYLSICRSINGSIPIAHRILTETPKNPLAIVLENKPDKTIDNRYFYQQLIKSCQDCIDKMPINSKEREKLETQVDIYHIKQKQVVSESGFFNVKTLVEKNKLVDIAKEKLSKEVAKQIFTDEEVQRTSQELTKRSKNLKYGFQKLCQNKKGISIAYNYIFQKEFVLSQEKIQAMQCTDVGFIELKKMVLDLYADHEELLANCEDLLAVKTKLSGVQIYSHKIKKETRKNIEEEKRLSILVQKQADELLLSKQSQNKDNLNNELVIKLCEFSQEIDSLSASLRELGFFPNEPSKHVLSGYASSSSSQGNEDQEIAGDPEDYIEPIDFPLF